MTDEPRTTPLRDIPTTVPDPTALKALAHPNRLKMLGILRLDGPTTATALARRMGLNSGATSYHLRQLAAYGFIEPDTARGNKRERWWRARHESTRVDSSEAQGEELEAGQAMTQAVLSQHAALMQRAHDRFPDLPPQWRRASESSDYILTLTAEQAVALMEKVHALLWEEKRKSPPPDTPRPLGTKQFMVLLHAFPNPGHDDLGGPEGTA